MLTAAAKRLRPAAWLAAGFLLAGCVQPAAPVRGGAADPAAPGVPAAVTTVASVGHWKLGAARGAYRLILVEEGFDPLVARLYLEWVAEGTAEAGPRIVAGRGFPELGAGFALALERVETGDDGRLEAVVAAVAAGEPGPRRYRLVAGPPGEAELSGPL